MKLILNNHKDNCLEICQYIENEFKLIIKQLNKRPENVEELVELETYMTGLYVCIYIYTCMYINICLCVYVHRDIYEYKHIRI